MKHRVVYNTSSKEYTFDTIEDSCSDSFLEDLVWEYNDKDDTTMVLCVSQNEDVAKRYVEDHIRRYWV